MSLAAVGLLAAGAAALAGSGSAPGGDGPAELTPALASGEAFMDPIALANAIRSRQPLRLLDVRDSSAFIRFSLPTARHAPLAELDHVERTAGEAAGEGAPIVVYDDGGGAAIRAWLLLRRLGHPDVRILQGGALGWVDRVLNPVLPAGTPEERARFDSVAQVSRYFGGLPKVGDPKPLDTDPARTEAAITLISRRGCY